MILNGIHQFLIYADINILGSSVYTIKKNTVILVAASRQIGLEVNADKTKRIAMSRDENAEEIHSIMFATVPLK